MDRIVDFLFESGMLKRTPRSGWQFLGAAGESVADHVFRTTLLTFVLARLDGTVDADRALRMALVHDLAEARTGDLNYVHQKYATLDEERAARDMLHELPFADEVAALLSEYHRRDTPEARLVYDADQLEMLLSLKEREDAGSPAARDWTPFVLRRLLSPRAVALAERILATSSARWWFDQGSDWWVRGGKGPAGEQDG